MSGLIREREQLVGRLAAVERELAAVRRALGLAPDQEHRACEVCQADFLVTRDDQRLCSGCREASPSRSVEDVKDRAAGATLIEIWCHGVGKGADLVACAKKVQKPNNRRGPLRCPDCALAQKRYNTKHSLRRTAKTKRANLERIASAPTPPEPEPEPVLARDLVVEAGRPTVLEPDPEPDPADPSLPPLRTRKTRPKPEYETVWSGGDSLTQTPEQRRRG